MVMLFLIFMGIASVSLIIGIAINHATYEEKEKSLSDESSDEGGIGIGYGYGYNLATRRVGFGFPTIP